MSTLRETGDPCPLDGQPLNMDKCQPCRFFRGASKKGGAEWTILCNWPRNGSTIDPNPAKTEPDQGEPFDKTWWLRQW